MPRNAANKLPTGGRLAIWCAVPDGTPWAMSPRLSVDGSALASPAIMSEKKTPIDSTKPEFWNVASIPDAAPRCLAGTLFMIAAAFGAENRPIPAPATKIRTANAAYRKSVGSTSRPPKAAADTSSPPEANARAPCLSDSQPETGPETTKPQVSGSR